MARVYNFSAGPSMLPEKVLRQAQAELLEYGDSGQSVMEMSHRSKWFDAIIKDTEASLRRVMNIPDNYKVGFFQGGATQQFAMVPLNFMTTGKADYIVSGNFSGLAAKEAAKFGEAKIVASSKDKNFTYIPDVNAIDYDKDAQVTHEFYAMVQNKFHYAITGQTAAEIVYTKADRLKEHMGLTTWKNAPEGRILKSDVLIAKNYLEEKQIRQLERAVTGYFDYIEDLIERENTFTMEEFAASVNEFLAFRRYDILRDKGKISGRMAKEKAATEYAEFNKTQKITSDFDKEVKKMLEKGGE